MGGDHSITEPVLKAMAEQHGPISLIQIDAHSDTWEENSRRLDHGSMFYQAAKESILDAKRSIQAGLSTHNAKSHGFNILTTEFVHEQGVEATIKKIKEVARDRVAYLTFDIDALDPVILMRWTQLLHQVLEHRPVVDLRHGRQSHLFES